MTRNLVVLVLWQLLLPFSAFGRNPVLFVHGFTGSAASFETVMQTLVLDYGWTYGGELAVDLRSGFVTRGQALSVGTEPRAGDFYTMDFSDYQLPYPSQNLELETQGAELKKIVEKVLELSGKPQVILVGYSMGGLACRAYLQYFRAAKVEQVIFINTPHQGADPALLAGSEAIKVLTYLFGKDIDPESRAVKLLQPGSAALQKLNNFSRYPLPVNTGLSCLITENDGLVKVASQDLSRAPSAEQFSQEVFRFVFLIPGALSLSPDNWPHTRVLRTKEAINALVEVVNQTFPKAEVESQFHYLAGGADFAIRLGGAPLAAPVFAMGWKDNERLWENYLPQGQTTSAGDFTWSGKAPREEAEYAIQFQVQGRLSNCVRVNLRREHFPRLKLELQLPRIGDDWFEVRVVLAGARPSSPVVLTLIYSSGREEKLPSYGRTNGDGDFWQWIEISTLEPSVSVRAEVAGDLSNLAGLRLRPARLLFILDRDGLSPYFDMWDMKLMRLASGQIVIVGNRPVIRFVSTWDKSIFFAGKIQALSDLVIRVKTMDGRDHEFAKIPAGGEQDFTIREGAGITEVAISAQGSGTTFWYLTNLVTTSDDEPPLLTAAFNPEPIPKGQKVGEGWWYSLLSLAEAADRVPFEIEKLEFAYADQSGKQLLVGEVPQAQLVKEGWFQRSLFWNWWFEECSGAEIGLDGQLWFTRPPGKVCQDLIYSFADSQVEPRYVQVRFFVKDVFGNRQTVTRSTLMLPK